VHRRYSIHRDGDLLVEDLDDQGRAIDPEPVPEGERLQLSVIVRAKDDADGRAQLLELLELAFEMEAAPPAEPDEASLMGPKTRR
jgi:hypothetical protein